ncbi:MAG: hypothetical protein A3J83_00525 [Elusimicrobia bacterium RIFOXYA2_FULL_40_6]|nr:MAG: hypothetical protein A3J83_00525 [Elusimicrobia bacterium RIFOXYA2_FULL_40_6]
MRKILLIILFGFIIEAQSSIIIQPYLQTPTSSSIYVCWGTDTNTESRVQYGTTSGLGSELTGSYTTINSTTIWHWVKLTGLDPETPYFYKCITGGNETDIKRFVTPCENTSIPASEHIRFAMYSDSHSGQPDKHLAIVNRMKTKLEEIFGSPLEDNVNLIMSCGDIEDDGNNSGEFKPGYFDCISTISGNVPYMVAPGNHEYYNSWFPAHTSPDPFFNFMKFEDIGGTEGEFYYSFRLSSVLFIVLNTNLNSNTQQQSWYTSLLTSAESDNTIDWIFVFQHAPVYNEAYVGESRWALSISTAVSTKVAMISAGHNHSYTRGQDTEKSTYLVTNGQGGGTMQGFIASATNYAEIEIAYSDWNFNVIDIDCTNKWMDFTAYSMGIGNSNVLVPISTDSFHLDKNTTDKPDKPTKVVAGSGTLKGSPFNSPNAESFQASQFQFSSVQGNYSSPLLNSVRNYRNIWGAAHTDYNAGINLTEYSTATLSLSTGQTYWWRVRYRDTNLAWSDWSDEYAYSLSPDTTPPTTPAYIYDGESFPDIAFTYSTTTLYANWTASTDTESGILTYFYALGTTPYGTNFLDWTNNGGINLYTYEQNLSLVIGTTYYFSVYAVNGQGLHSSTETSNGQYVTLDNTPPSTPSNVYDGLTSVDQNSTNSLNQLAANWTVCADTESGISKYLFAIGTAPAATNTVPWTDNGVSTYVIKGSLSLTKGATYYFSVKAINGSGVESSVRSSDGQYVENTAVAKFLISGSVKTSGQAGITSVVLTLTGTSTGTQTTGLTGVYMFGNLESGNYTLTPIKSGYTFMPANMVIGSLSADATNQNFVGAVVVSTEDITAPLDITNVYDGLGEDLSEITDNTQLSANWDASLDPQSFIARYWYAIGTTTGASNILDWTATADGNQTSVTVTNLNLANGTYFFSVYAENGAGLFSSITTSNGIIVNSANSNVYIDLTQAKLGPNPVTISRHGAGGAAGSAMKFTKLPANSQLMIYTISGKLVRTLNESNTEISFDGKNTNGDIISQGIYLYVIKTSSGLKKTGKIAIKVE